MAHTPPTYADFIARFPIFDNVVTWPQAMVEAVLVEATNNIDTDWFENDYAPAIMYQTAHVLSVENAETGADGAPSVGPQTYLSSESFAGMSQSFATFNADGALSKSEVWGSTSYGRRYLDLLRKNKPGPVIA